MRRRLALAAFVVIAAVQVLGPAQALRHSRPSVLGWHMFVGVKAPPAVELRFRDGSVARGEVEDHIWLARPDVDYPRRLTPRLCEAHDGLESVRYRREDPHLDEVVPC